RPSAGPSRQLGAFFAVADHEPPQSAKAQGCNCSVPPGRRGEFPPSRRLIWAPLQNCQLPYAGAQARIMAFHYACRALSNIKVAAAVQDVARRANTPPLPSAATRTQS